MIRLRELREERGWTMRDASKFLKKSYTTYVNHEKGYREPNSEDLVTYSKAYGVTIDYLIGRSNERFPVTNSDEESMDAEAKARLKECNDLFKSKTPEEQEIFLKFLRSLT